MRPSILAGLAGLAGLDQGQRRDRRDARWSGTGLSHPVGLATVLALGHEATKPLVWPLSALPLLMGMIGFAGHLPIIGDLVNSYLLAPMALNAATAFMLLGAGMLAASIVPRKAAGVGALALGECCVELEDTCLKAEQDALQRGLARHRYARAAVEARIICVLAAG
jgi:hypothetical protein